MERSSRALKWMQLLMPLLALLTLVLLIWHHFGMERVVELSAAAPHGVTIQDDGSEPDASPASGQPTRSTLEKRTDALLLHCHPGRAFSWPYCKFQFVTGNGSRGPGFIQF